MTLARQCRADNATAVASVFVNPTQFAPSEDLATYPRDMDGDLDKLREAGFDMVFAPSAEEMYPDGFDTTIDVGRNRAASGRRAAAPGISRRGDGRLQVCLP